MATEVRLRRGTATEHETFIGASGEVTVDTTNKQLRVHDGVTPGGSAVASAAAADAKYAHRSNNLSDLADKAVARSNLSLGTAALRDVGTGAAQVPTNDILPLYNVNTLSALQALPLSTPVNTSVYMLGRVTAGDGGGGRFFWKTGNFSVAVASDEMTVGQGNGGIVVAPGADRTGASGAWFRAYEDSVYPEWYGAVGDKIADDQPAIQKALDNCPAGRSVALTRKYRVANSLNIPESVGLKGIHIYPFKYNMQELAETDSLILLDGSPRATINMVTDTHVVGLSIFPYGRTFPATKAEAESWEGMAILMQDNHRGFYVAHCAIGGFAYGISTGFVADTSNVVIENMYMDNSECIRISKSYDVCYLSNIHCAPGLSRPLPEINFERAGSAIILVNVGNWLKVTNVYSYGYLKGFDLFDVDNCTLIGCGANTNPSTIRESIGFIVRGTCKETVLIGCQAAAHFNGFRIATTDAQISDTKLVGCTAWACGNAGFVFTSGRSTAVNCGAHGCSKGFDLQTSDGTLWMACTSVNNNSGFMRNGYANLRLVEPTFKGTISAYNTDELWFPSVASALTMQIDPTYQFYKVTGTVNIQEIQPQMSYRGKILTLSFSAMLTLITEAGNFKLQNGAHVVVNIGDVIQLFADADGFWHQVSQRIDA